MEKCGHYERWREDFDSWQALGISLPALRPADPPHLARPGSLRLGFRRPRLRRAAAQRHDARSSTCAISACPTGSAIFKTRTSRSCFADYAEAFARRFPGCSSTRRSTRCSSARCFSARYGWWNEQLTSDRAFVTALKHIVKANVLAMHAILDVRPDAIFIQSESSEYFHAENPQAIKPAEIMNAKRFLSLDLNYGRRVNSRDVRVPDGQRHDARRIPFLPATTTSSTTASWGTTITSPTSTG